MTLLIQFKMLAEGQASKQKKAPRINQNVEKQKNQWNNEKSK